MRLKSWIALIALALSGLSASAGSMLLTGVGPAPSVASTYVGPGDTFSTSAIAAFSCAQAYTAAYASGGGNACDLVDSAAPTTVICTLKFLSTGLVDLASASCTGSITPATKCAAATGGKCNISKVYNQVSPGTLDVVQTTAASQPTLSFSSTPTGTLPAINCGVFAGNLSISSTGTFTQAQPFTMFAVLERVSDFTSSGGAIGSQLAGNVQGISSGSATNTAAMIAGAGVNTSGATDSAWHSIGGLANNTSGAINIDGTDTTSYSDGTNSFSAANIRLCRGNGGQYPGLIAEAILYGATTNTANRNALSTNAHSAGRYNF